MAHPELLPFTVAFCMFMFLSHSSPEPSPAPSPSEKQEERVNLSLYYETLCPGCADFITNDLVNAFNTDLHNIVDLRLVPWGNARLTDGKIICQHGEDECYLNTIDGCVINLWPDVATHFNFIRCVEQQVLEGQTEVANMWQVCCKKLKLSQKAIKGCYDSGYGRKLQLKYANETESLNPPHEYVPWVVVNNKPIREDFHNFVTYVCQAYKGDHVPEACKSQISSLNSAKEVNLIIPDCSA